MKRKTSTRTIAPRLANGESREPLYQRLPPATKQGLRMIAKDENKSISWVVEEVIIAFFKLRRPRYVKTVGERRKVR